MKTCIVLGMMSWLLVSSGCRTTRSSGMDKHAFNYLALGDSYTIGESVEESERYPNQLAESLQKEGIVVDEPTIIARTGWRTSDLQQGIESSGISHESYDLVTLLIGVNNEFRQRSQLEYEKEFAVLLSRAIRFAGGKKERVFVLSIPDYGYTPYGEERQAIISARIDQFNAINKRITDSLKVTYIDITPVSRKGLSDPSLVATDGLHPSGKQYGEWVGLLLRPVVKRLKR
jgi:lysophospholipase L1-like esterase